MGKYAVGRGDNFIQKKVLIGRVEGENGQLQWSTGRSNLDKFPGFRINIRKNALKNEKKQAFTPVFY